MSQFPNMNQPGSDPYNPFSASPASQPPPRKTSPWLYILLGVGGAGLLVCCGCIGGGWWLASFGMGVVSEALKSQLNSDPIAQEHLGTVTDVSFDFMGSGEEQEKQGRQVLVFDVTGDKGSGTVIAEQTPGQQTFQNAILRLPDGDEVDLGF